MIGPTALQVLEARAGNLASGVPEFRVPYSTCSCNLATASWASYMGNPQQLRPSSQMRSARIQPGRWLLANTPSSRAFTCRAQAMRA